jgi:hypothetical protein
MRLAAALLPAISLTVLPYGAARAAQAPTGIHQWSEALWPTGLPMTLFDLIEQGYEVRTYQPGLEHN